MDQYLILFFGYYSFEIFLMESGKFDKNMIGSGSWELSFYFYAEQWALSLSPPSHSQPDGCRMSLLFGSQASTLIGFKKKLTINHKIYK